MERIIEYKQRRYNRWNNDYISPGPVAVVGDVLVNEKLKKSCPELAPRYRFPTDVLRYRGVGVQDGTWSNFHNDALAARTDRQTSYDIPFESTQVGTEFQDLRLIDLKAETRLLGAPQFGWKNQKATLLNARVTGEQFLPNPEGYAAYGLSRGQRPRVNVFVDNTGVLPSIEPPKRLLNSSDAGNFGIYGPPEQYGGRPGGPPAGNPGGGPNGGGGGGGGGGGNPRGPPLIQNQFDPTANFSCVRRT